jgi:hypothetical protein
MGYGMYGSAAAMVFVAGLGVYSVADRGMSYQPATASVTTIDRSCNFVETRTEANGLKTATGLTDSCNSTGDWDEVREAVREKRRKKIAGNATLHLSYIAPQDGRAYSAEIKITGGDDAFYELQAGSQIKILVSNSDPTKIRKA